MSTSFIFYQVVECESTDDGRDGNIIESITHVYTDLLRRSTEGTTVDITNGGRIVVEMIVRSQPIIGRLIHVTLSCAGAYWGDDTLAGLFSDEDRENVYFFGAQLGSTVLTTGRMQTDTDSPQLVRDNPTLNIDVVSRLSTRC